MDKSTRVKDITHAGVTLSRSNLTREHCMYAIQDIACKYIVASENHAIEGTHIHMYINLIEPINIQELRELLLLNELFTEDISCHIDSLKSPKSWIKYITKEDETPLYDGVSSTEMHISYRLHDYIVNHRHYNAHDAFIRQHPQYTNVWRTAHTDYWQTNPQEKDYEQTKVVPDYTKLWVQQTSVSVACKENIYLWGDTGTGKTTIINDCVQKLIRLRQQVTTVPCTLSPFEFSQVSTRTSLVIAPDVCAGYINTHRQQILQMCDRSCIGINPKCAPVTSFKFNGSLCIVSNFPPPDDPAVLRRFKVIQAIGHGFQKIKTEVQEETYLISSDSETSD